LGVKKQREGEGLREAEKKNREEEAQGGRTSSRKQVQKTKKGRVRNLRDLKVQANHAAKRKMKDPAEGSGKKMLTNKPNAK